MAKNIIFIGFMGVGKGTITRALVKEGNFVSLDTDDMIESMENRKVKEIFDTEGEAYFRELERRTAKWLEKNIKNTLISTGGGFYKVKNLHKIGKVIYLQSSFEGIIQRLKDHPQSEKKFKKRPLLQHLDKAKELFDQRVKEYESKADYIIDVENKNIRTITKEIFPILKENF
jgi:shikimate kinase